MGGKHIGRRELLDGVGPSQETGGGMTGSPIFNLRLENTGSNIQKNVILVSNAPCIGNIHCVCVCVFAMCVCGRACVRVRACVRGTTPNAGGACRLSLVSTRIYNGKLLQLLLVLLIITVARLAS